jgi:hypothetical protein
MLLLAARAAVAADEGLGRFIDWSAAETEWNHRFSLGAGLRLEARDERLVGKSNLDPTLCAVDDCLAASADNRAANDRYLAAPGALNSVYDEGNLNYDQGELFAAPLKYTTRWGVKAGSVRIELSGLAFYDLVNANRDERRPNLITTPGPQPGVAARTRRSANVRRDIGFGAQLLDAYLLKTFEIAGRDVDVSFGRQRLVWGEASFVTQGSLNVINPPDANNLTRPGADFDEIYRPQTMLLVKAPLYDDLAMEAFWQLEWRPVALPARGSFFSFFNASNEVGDDEGIIGPFAKAPYDPQQVGTPANDTFALVTQTSYTVRRGANREPEGLGQGGLALYYAPPQFEETEFGFYAANTHARIPAASAFASDASCARREGNPGGIDAIDLTSFINACGVPGSNTREAVPLDSARYFLDYAENVQLYGLSFGTVWQGIAVRGELAYRPNQPVQVDLEDVLFAALQPALPRQDIPLFDTAATVNGLITQLQDPQSALGTALAAAGNLDTTLAALQTLLNSPDGVGTTVPGSRTGIPDFVTAYRGGVPGEVVPGQYIRGYERLQTVQASLALTKVFGQTGFLRSRDAALLFELTSIAVPELPSTDLLQFEAPGTDTHAGPGAFDSNNALRINPIRNTAGYVEKLSAGYRLGALLTYPDLLVPGLTLRPLLVFTHDVVGTSPGLGENFLEGRRLGILDLRATFRQFNGSLTHGVFMGAGRRNTLRDRDFLMASVGLSF